MFTSKMGPSASHRTGAVTSQEDAGRNIDYSPRVSYDMNKAIHVVSSCDETHAPKTDYGKMPLSSDGQDLESNINL